MVTETIMTQQRSPNNTCHRRLEVLILVNHVRFNEQVLQKTSNIGNKDSQTGVENVVMLDPTTNKTIAFEILYMKTFALIELNFLHSVFIYFLNTNIGIKSGGNLPSPQFLPDFPERSW